MKVEPLSMLENEATHFFHELFSREAPQIIKIRYQNAHEYMFNESLEQELQTVRLVVEHRLNAEAVEVFLRRQDRPHILTLKMQLLVYLAELHVSGYRLFVNEADARGRAALTILGALARWPYMLLKGAYLTWRYQLV
jgi:hypothetical protein